MKNESKIIKEKDSWYKQMGERKAIHPENEPVVGLMEWVDLMVDYKI
jgi:hypothetical protein